MLCSGAVLRGGQELEEVTEVKKGRRGSGVAMFSLLGGLLSLYTNSGSGEPARTRPRTHFWSGKSRSPGGIAGKEIEAKLLLFIKIWEEDGKEVGKKNRSARQTFFMGIIFSQVLLDILPVSKNRLC